MKIYLPRLFSYKLSSQTWIMSLKEIQNNTQIYLKQKEKTKGC